MMQDVLAILALSFQFCMHLRKTYTAKMSCIICIDSATYLLTISLPNIHYNVSVLPYVRMLCMVVQLLSCCATRCVTECPITHRDTTYVQHCVSGYSAAVPFHSAAQLQTDLMMYNMAEFQKYIKSVFPVDGKWNKSPAIH